MNPTQAIFTPPAANVDNSPVANGEIVKYRLEIGLVVTDGSAQTFPQTIDDVDVTPTAEDTIAVPLDPLNLVPGNYVGQVVAITGANVSSAPSATVAFSIAAPVVTPNPPTALKFV